MLFTQHHRCLGTNKKGLGPCNARLRTFDEYYIKEYPRKLIDLHSSQYPTQRALKSINVFLLVRIGRKHACKKCIRGRKWAQKSCFGHPNVDITDQLACRLKNSSRNVCNSKGLSMLHDITITIMMVVKQFISIFSLQYY